MILASESNAVPVVEVLVQRGADLLAVDSQGHDVTHYIKLLGNSEVKTALVAALNRQQISGESYAHRECRKDTMRHHLDVKFYEPIPTLFTHILDP